jgi:hypothetical protein
MPQFVRLVWRFAQVVPHIVCPEEHDDEQVPPWQV